MKEAHKYDASNFEYLDEVFKSGEFMDYGLENCPGASASLNPKLSTLNCKSDSDVNPDSPICIGMDYNANINWIVAGQPQGRKLKVIKSFFTKFERKIPALIDDFCAYYADHRNKTVIFYYDTATLGDDYAVNDQDFRWVVIHEFERHGWQVNDVYLGNPMRHDEPLARRIPLSITQYEAKVTAHQPRLCR